MQTRQLQGIAIATLLSTMLAGYRLGAGAWPTFKRTPVVSASMAEVPRTERRVLYWKDPDHGMEFSATASKTADGRDYVPVYDDQEPDLAGATPKARIAAGKILYYRNPMGLPDTSPVPKKDSMGMDYIAVRDGEDDAGSSVKVSLDKVQRSGVRTAVVEMRRMVRPIRAPGIVKPDERTLRSVTLRADAFIEKLYANQTGQFVVAGQPLFRIYSPQMVAVQVDFTVANGGAARDDRGPTQRLKNLDMPDAVLKELARTRTPILAFDWPSPASGVILKKDVVEGMQMKAGQEIFRIADLSTVWVIADVAEQDVASVRLGAPAKVTFRAFPGEAFDGKVTFVLHELDTATRTAKVRVEVKNPDHRIFHEMFADVDINAGANEPERLVVPLSAVIDSGDRQVVLIDLGEGRFEPRPLTLGVRGDGLVEILKGVKVGEHVVTSATFLLDAESNLKAALSRLIADAPPNAEGKP